MAGEQTRYRVAYRSMSNEKAWYWASADTSFGTYSDASDSMLAKARFPARDVCIVESNPDGTFTLPLPAEPQGEKPNPFTQSADENTRQAFAKTASRVPPQPPPPVDVDEPLMIQGKTMWDFCCEWYGVDEIEQSIERDFGPFGNSIRRVPTDVRSHYFAVWLGDQYRLAMRKGMEVAHQSMLADMRRSRQRLAELEAELRECAIVSAPATGNEATDMKAAEVTAETPLDKIADLVNSRVANLECELTAALDEIVELEVEAGRLRFTIEYAASMASGREFIQEYLTAALSRLAPSPKNPAQNTV